MSAISLKTEDKLNKEISSFFKKTPFKYKEPITLKSFLKDKILIITAIRKGLPYSIFELIQEMTPFTETEWADLLELSTKSLYRYKSTSGYTFKSSHSEKIIEMAEVTNIGLEVFGSMAKLKLWLITPVYALGNVKPIELLKDSYGKELVIKELTHIDQGIFV